MHNTKENKKDIKIDRAILGENVQATSNTVKTVINGEEITVKIPKND